MAELNHDAARESCTTAFDGHADLANLARCYLDALERAERAEAAARAQKLEAAKTRDAHDRDGVALIRVGRERDAALAKLAELESFDRGREGVIDRLADRLAAADKHLRGLSHVPYALDCECLIVSCPVCAFLAATEPEEK